MIQSPYFKKIVALLKISIFSKKCFFIFSLGPPPKNTPQEVTVLHTHTRSWTASLPRKNGGCLEDDPVKPPGFRGRWATYLPSKSPVTLQLESKVPHLSCNRWRKCSYKAQRCYWRTDLMDKSPEDWGEESGPVEIVVERLGPVCSTMP